MILERVPVRISHPSKDEDNVFLVVLESPAVLEESASRLGRDAIRKALKGRSAPKVAIDLGRVDLLSSAGLGLLVNLKRRVDAQKGSLVLFNVHAEVQRQLRQTALIRLFSLADDRASALELLQTFPVV